MKMQKMKAAACASVVGLGLFAQKASATAQEIMDGVDSTIAVEITSLPTAFFASDFFKSIALWVLAVAIGVFVIRWLKKH